MQTITLAVATMDLPRRRGRRAWSGALCAGCGMALVIWGTLAAEELPAERPDFAPPPIAPEGIAGSLVICGGGGLPDAIRDEFMKLAGGTEARLVIIPTASDDVDLEQDAAEILEIWKARRPATAVVLHTRARDQANAPQFTAPLQQATAVWISGGKQSLLAPAYTGTAVERELHALLKRGGVIGGTSAGAAIMSRLMIVRGHPYDVPGLGLLPGVVIDQHFIARNRKPRLVAALEKYPGLVGLGIDEGTALVARGRSLRVLGESTVTICLRGSQTRPARETVLKPGETADLTALCRAAVARTQPPFPPAELLVPNLPQGTLVIVGGGKMPLGLPEKFIELAGGPEALIAVLPTANPDPLPEKLGDAAFLERAGAKDIKLLRARTREEVESPEFLEAIQAARGIWFGGGRQWRFVDAYGETRAVPAFHDVLRRGGVIGGSSAGATIQGDYLVRGSPLGNEEMMAEGYERGFAFLPGVAIDQHFSQRKRQPDMTQVMQAHPQLLGIGLDESTALIVRGHTAEIVGEHDAYFYNRRQPLVDGQPDYEKVPSGQHYDLVARKVKGAAQP